MAQGLSATRVGTDTVSGALINRLDTTVLTPTAGSRIVGVDVQPGSAPEAALIGYNADATGDVVTLTWRVAGPSVSVLHNVSFIVTEVTDA